MPNLEDRMPRLLHDLTSEARPDPSLEHRVLGRSRRRRVTNVVFAGLTVAVVVVAGFLVAGALGARDRMTPADGATSPTEIAPTPLPAIWPEADARALAIAQAQLDAGFSDRRLDPVKAAEAYANVELGWDATDIQVQDFASDPASGITMITIANAGLGPGAGGAGPPAPETALSLRQLGVTGERGLWSVVAADSDRIVPEDERPASAQAGTQLRLAGSLLDVRAEWSLGVSIMTFRFHPEEGVTTSAASSSPRCRAPRTARSPSRSTSQLERLGRRSSRSRSWTRRERRSRPSPSPSRSSPPTSQRSQVLPAARRPVRPVRRDDRPTVAGRAGGGTRGSWPIPGPPRRRRTRCAPRRTSTAARRLRRS